MRVTRPHSLTHRMPGLWERNLYVLWVAQATSAMGFSFFSPFMPLFIQKLGIEDPGQAALWSGIAGGVGFLFMMVSGPFWGILGDRYGLKKNILRAMFGSAIVLGLTGLATDVYQLVAFRIMLGLVSGALVTVMAMVSATAPRAKVSYGIGVVLSATFVGFTVGPFIGGQLADSFGFRQTFLVAGALCALAGLLVLIFVRESFQRAERREKLGPHLVVGNLVEAMRSPGLAPVLVVVLLASVGPTIMMPVLPVFIGTLSTAGTAASSVGVTFSIMGCMAAVSSMVTSRLSQRFGITPVLIVAFIGGGLLFLPLLVANTLFQVYVITALMGLFNGGLSTLSFGLVGTTVPKDKQGAAYGVALSASSLGVGSGTLIGGTIAGTWGLREVFLVNAVVLLATAIVATRLFGKQQAEPAPGAEPDLEPATQAAGDD